MSDENMCMNCERHVTRSEEYRPLRPGESDGYPGLVKYPDTHVAKARCEACGIDVLAIDWARHNVNHPEA